MRRKKTGRETEKDRFEGTWLKRPENTREWREWEKYALLLLFSGCYTDSSTFSFLSCIPNEGDSFIILSVSPVKGWRQRRRGKRTNRERKKFFVYKNKFGKEDDVENEKRKQSFSSQREDSFYQTYYHTWEEEVTECQVSQGKRMQRMEWGMNERDYGRTTTVSGMRGHPCRVSFLVCITQTHFSSRLLLIRY